MFLADVPIEVKFAVKIRIAVQGHLMDIIQQAALITLGQVDIGNVVLLLGKI